MFFQSWEGVFRVFLCAVVGYVGLIATLRISGKRSLSKMNAYDFVVTVALGSTLANVTLTKDIALLEGITAFLTLCAVQYLTSWLVYKSPRFDRFITAQPSLLMYRGVFMFHVMKRTRVTKSEVLAAMRTRGVECDRTEAVVLETDGSLSVLPKSETMPSPLLSPVEPPACDEKMHQAGAGSDRSAVSGVAAGHSLHHA